MSLSDSTVARGQHGSNERAAADSQRELDRLRFELRERQKELAGVRALARCLIKASSSPTWEWLDDVVACIPPAFQWPELTEAEVCVGAHVARTPGYATRVNEHTPCIASRWVDRDDVPCYLMVANTGVHATNAPFLAEEYPLVDSMAELIRVAYEGARDARERAQAEHELRQSELRLELTLNAARTGIVEWDLRANVAHLSRTARELLMLPPETTSITREEMREHIHPDDRAAVREYLDRQIAYSTTRHHEFRLLQPDGTIRWVLSQGQSFYDPAGFPERRLSVVVDITDRRQLEEQYRQAQKLEAMGRLAGGVAHDFNNLLTIIGAAAEFVSDAAPDDSSIRDDVRDIQTSVDRGRSLTRQLLTFSRRQVVRIEHADLSDLVRASETMLQRLIGSTIAFRLDAASTALPIRIDPHQLDQLVMNLVANARDAMPEGGQLTITTAVGDLTSLPTGACPELLAGPCAVLSVSDTGVGMDAATRARIFEPFFTTKDPTRGTGLGLATAFGIVKQANGCIDVESTPGHGSTFRVFLPLASALASTSESLDADVAVTARGSETILLVEPESGVRLLARRTLRDLGYQVLEATDGVEALDIARSYDGRIHLLLCDLVLPLYSGREVADALVLERPALPSLFMTGHGDEHRLSQSVMHDGATVIEKPFTRQALALAVRQAIEAA